MLVYQRVIVEKSYSREIKSPDLYSGLDCSNVFSHFEHRQIMDHSSIVLGVMP